MMIKLDLSISDPVVIQENLEKPCCEDKQTHECHTHFLTPGLKTQLKESVASDNRGSTAKILAELAKFSSCREFLFDEAIISSLVKNLGGKHLELLLQSCRALANLCYESDEAQKLIIAQNGLEALSAILMKPTGGSDAEKQLRAAAVGFLLNLITDNPNAQQKIVGSDVPGRLLELAEEELESRSVTTLSQHIILILVTLAESSPMDQVLTKPVCEVAVKLLNICQADSFFTPALQFLEGSKVDDRVKERLVSAGLLELLCKHMEGHPVHASQEEIENYELIGRVISNILTGDEAMAIAYESQELKLVTRFEKWLRSNHYAVVYSSALCLGNLARTDPNSIHIVDSGLHSLLLDCLQRDLCDSKIQHAVFGTLRNLAIPKETKARLISDGVLEATLPLISLDVRNAGPVIFKLIGVWRQLACEPEVAVRLGANVDLIKQLVTWSEGAVSPWVPSEALRLLCALITKSKDKAIVENLISAAALPEITKLLTSQHTIMQTEAVNAITVGVALMGGNSAAIEDALLSADICDKLKLLINTPSIPLQLVENVFTMFETLGKLGKLRSKLIGDKVNEELAILVSSNSQFGHLRPRLEKLANVT